MVVRTSRRCARLTAVAGCLWTASLLAASPLLAQSTPSCAVVPIPGSRQRRNILENRRAADLSLSPGEIAEIEAIFAPDAIMGARYSEIEAARAGL